MVRGIPENEDASPMIVAFRFDIRVCHQEYGKNDDYNVPTRKYETTMGVVVNHSLYSKEKLT